MPRGLVGGKGSSAVTALDGSGHSGKGKIGKKRPNWGDVEFAPKPTQRSLRYDRDSAGVEFRLRHFPAWRMSPVDFENLAERAQDSVKGDGGIPISKSK